MLGTGGLSHQLDGERAGFINKPFDLYCLEKIVHEPEMLARYSIRDLVELAGTQGPELIQWLVMRGALGPAVRRAREQLSRADFQHGFRTAAAGNRRLNKLPARND